MPVYMAWTKKEQGSGLNLHELEEAFQDGARLFLFSNPNNPTGAVCSREELEKIAGLCRTYGVTVIADELYSRQMYDGARFTHFSSLENRPETMLTIIGPSKTESMSGFRLGVAFGSPSLIRRMEKLQAIMTLRCSGYNQAVFADCSSEPEGWLAGRVAPIRLSGRAFGDLPPGRHGSRDAAGRKLPFRQFAKAGSQSGAIYRAASHPGRRYRHTRHGVRTPIHQLVSHQLLPGPRQRHGRRGAHRSPCRALPPGKIGRKAYTHCKEEENEFDFGS